MSKQQFQGMQSLTCRPNVTISPVGPMKQNRTKPEYLTKFTLLQTLEKLFLRLTLAGSSKMQLPHYTDSNKDEIFHICYLSFSLFLQSELRSLGK